ncbi:hypothetical protein NIES267_73540 (plasmid) [Calothrix parasitica NIES-267]|uniref:Uncharacterized protein n=1 Tax=Calothrix parasitica NIES-267 TaxID=1973488 RepID=A0A1Z4M2X6_9CYAN|nr:hypothetical protein NIES267_73540 [Calothrix parasitica NIES-267]
MTNNIIKIKMKDNSQAKLYKKAEVKPKAKVGRKSLSEEERERRRKINYQKKYGDKIVFQARVKQIDKDRILALKEQLGFTSNDQLLEWFIERGERSLARKNATLKK